MIPKPFTYTMRIVGCALLLAVVSGTADRPARAAELRTFEYEQKDALEEKKKSIQRLETDRRKIEAAVQTTRTLIDRSRHRPYLPELYLRLAELHIEKSRVVYLLRKSRDPESKSSLDHLESNSLKKEAIGIYQRILDHFPDFADRDKVHFFMAHEYGELGQLDQMVKQYQILISRYKDSQYAPEAYLLLGDYFFSRQNLPHALKNYQAVLNYPDSPASVIARYKLGWCHINNADYSKALALFKEAVVSSNTSQEVDIDTYRHVNVRLEALIDMAFCYPEVYKKSAPEKALAYFQQYAWSRQAYTTVLDKLANRYYIKKKWHTAAVVYRQLAELRNDPENLIEYAGRIYECVQAMGRYKDVDQDVKYIVKALEQQQYSIHIPEAQKKKTITEYELFARDIITHLHDRARKQKSQRRFEQAAAAYKTYLDFFRNSPVRLEMQANYAGALFASHQYMDAGRQYEQLAMRGVKRKKIDRGALYGAVTAYYHAIKNKDSLDYYHLAYARQGLRTTGKTYAAVFPKSKKTPDVLFNVAWIAYDAGKLDEAIAEFSAFIDAYPNSRSAEAAVHLTLDAYYQKEDYQGLTEFGRRMLGSGRLKDRKLKLEVARIVKGAESKIVSEMTLSAVNDYEKGRSGLIQLASQAGSGGVSEQALNALIVTSKENKDLATFFTAGANLVARYPKSDQIESTLNLMIETALQSHQYRLLADSLESFCRTLPQHKNSPAFLYQAGQIRQGLGQYKRANADYRRLLAKHPSSSKMRDEVIFAMADNSQKMGQKDAALRILNGHYKMLSQRARIGALATMADLYYRTGNTKLGGSYRRKALKTFKPQMAKNNLQVRDAMARMEYNVLEGARKRYMVLRLKKRLDNSIVAAKQKQLQTLEKGYQRVLGYQSPQWALRACYQLAAINREFARFLKESPLPALNAGQRQQYVSLLDQKVRQYAASAREYEQTCRQLAQRWEICEPDLIAYLNRSGASAKANRNAVNFAGHNRDASIAAGSLKDPELKSLHQQVIESPDSLAHSMALADRYLEKQDYRQAAMIAQNALEKVNRQSRQTASSLSNLLGISWLYAGEDELAKDAFKQAIEQDSDNVAARINLAGLFQHYGHSDKAQMLYRKIKSMDPSEQAERMVHPRAGDLLYANRKITQK